MLKRFLSLIIVGQTLFGCGAAELTARIATTSYGCPDGTDDSSFEIKLQKLVEQNGNPLSKFGPVPVTEFPLSGHLRRALHSDGPKSDILDSCAHLLTLDGKQLAETVPGEEGRRLVKMYLKRSGYRLESDFHLKSPLAKSCARGALAGFIINPICMAAAVPVAERSGIIHGSLTGVGSRFCAPLFFGSCLLKNTCGACELVRYRLVRDKRSDQREELYPFESGYSIFEQAVKPAVSIGIMTSVLALIACNPSLHSMAEGALDFCCTGKDAGVACAGYSLVGCSSCAAEVAVDGCAECLAGRSVEQERAAEEKRK